LHFYKASILNDLQSIKNLKIFLFLLYLFAQTCDNIDIEIGYFKARRAEMETTMERLTQDRLEELAERNNWEKVEYDNDGILTRKLAGSDDWLPVTQAQISEVSYLRCEVCDEKIEIGTEKKHTTERGHILCSYACMESLYNDDIPGDEEFLKN
jgi:hypothetical protein